MESSTPSNPHPDVLGAGTLHPQSSTDESARPLEESSPEEVGPIGVLARSSEESDSVLGAPELAPVSPELPFLPPFVLGALYPLVEGQQVEFKHSLQHPASVVKMADTVCGFLNSAGGFLLVGAYVVGSTRRCC